MMWHTTEQTPNAILRIIEEEGQRLSVEPEIENKERRSRTNELVVSLKANEKTFRITFNWVRDDLINTPSFDLDHGYIETEWMLVLRPTNRQLPIGGPFQWELESNDESIKKGSHPDTLEEAWQRQLIRKKLAIEPLS